MPVLDTSFLIALQAGDEKALELLATMKDEPLLVPGIVAVEFLTPFGAKAEKTYVELDRSFSLVHTSADWVLAAARLRQRLHRERRSIRLADFWIAAWAVLHDTPVVTRNATDFAAMGVATLTW